MPVRLGLHCEGLLTDLQVPDPIAARSVLRVLPSAEFSAQPGSVSDITQIPIKNFEFSDCPLALDSVIAMTVLSRRHGALVSS